MWTNEEALVRLERELVATFRDTMKQATAENRIMLGAVLAALDHAIAQQAQIVSLIIACGDIATLQALAAHFGQRRHLEDADVAGHA